MTDNAMQITIEAHGGVTEMYEAAYKKFSYDKFLGEEYAVSEQERSVWLNSMMHNLEVHHAWQVQTGRFIGAIQTRRLLGQLLGEMGPLIEKLKAAAQGESQ